MSSTNGVAVLLLCVSCIWRQVAAASEDDLRSSKHDLDFHGLNILGERFIDEHHDVHDYPGHKDLGHHETSLYDYHDTEKDDYPHFGSHDESEESDDSSQEHHPPPPPSYHPPPPPSYPQPTYPQPSYPEPSYPAAPQPYQEPPSYPQPVSYPPPPPPTYPQPSYPQPQPHYRRPRKMKPKVIIVKKVVPLSTTTYRG